MYTKAKRVHAFMGRALMTVLAFVLALGQVIWLAPQAGADPVYPELISQNSAGVSGEGNSSEVMLSDDGRYAAFMSDATNFDPDPGSIPGVYWRDRQTGTTRLVSVNSSGDPHNGHTLRLLGISGNGRYVFFASYSSTNIDPRTGNNIYPFRHDTVTGVSELIGLDENDSPVASDWRVSSSYDGGIVAFAGFRTPSQNLSILFVRDLTNDVVLKIVDQSGWAYLDSDGSHLLYTSTVTNDWVTEVADITSGTSVRLDLREDGQNSPEEFDSEGPMGLSADGRYGFFLTYDPELSSQTAAECQFHGCVYRVDTTNGAVQIVRAQVDGDYVYPQFLPEGLANDGKKFVFDRDQDGATGIYFADMENEVAYRVGYGPNWSTPSEPGRGSVISGDGSLVAFASSATNFNVPPLCPYVEPAFTATAQSQDVVQCMNIFVTTTDQRPNNLPDSASFSAMADTYVRGGQANRNHGASEFMNVQSSGSNRGLARFDQSEIESAIGSGTVLSAKLRLTIVDNGNNWGATGRTVDVHRLLTAWTEGNGTESDRGTGEGATWNCALDSLIQNQAKNCSGATEWEMGQPNNPAVHPWVSLASATQTIANEQTGVVEFDVTADLTGFLNGSLDNHGWIIKKTGENQNGQVSFGTRESSFSPQLVITYQP